MINAPLRAVYKTLVNVDKRPDWLEGVDTINREMTSERINMRHNCVFHGMTLVNTAVYSDFSENHARYSEKVEIPEINLTLLAHYEMEALGEASTRLNFNVMWSLWLCGVRGEKKRPAAGFSSVSLRITGLGRNRSR